MKTNFLFILLASILVLFGCSASQNSANKNVAGMYMNGLNLINPDYKVFHKNDTLTEFHFRLNSENILYTKKRGDSTFSANILIHYELTDKTSEQLIDSASIYFTDFSDNKVKKMLDGVIHLPTQANKNYTFTVRFNDISRDHYIQKNINLNRLNNHNPQNYLMVDSNKNIYFNNYFKTHDRITIIKNKDNANKSLLLKYYSTNLPIARPPFAVDGTNQTVKHEAQITKLLAFDSLHHLNYITNKRGLYHFQTSESIKDGPTIFNFEENFPKVKSLDNMIGPMRYISTKKEFAFLKESKNKKLAMDDFWLSIAGSNERARTLISEYFERVESANHHFTSYLEGWKTDRGIIYIIYGAPNVVYKGNGYENWIYGEENNMMSTSFIFYQVTNPVSNNHFKLNRSNSYKNSWFRAVDSWRSGRIY